MTLCRACATEARGLWRGIRHKGEIGTMHNRQDRPEESNGEAGVEAASGGRKSRLERRLDALQERQRRPEPISVLRLLNTEEIPRALALIERAGVMPGGEVTNPQAFREAPSEELEALEHWRELCGEPLDHLELAEELLDRVGEAKGWRSPKAMEAALLLKRLELPDESPWYVTKTAEAVVAFYAELEEHGVGRGGGALHPHVRGAVRRLERLKEIDRISPESRSAGPATEREERIETGEAPRRTAEGAGDARARTPGRAPASVEEPPAGAERPSWWRRFFGFE